MSAITMHILKEDFKSKEEANEFLKKCVTFKNGDQYGIGYIEENKNETEETSLC